MNHSVPVGSKIKSKSKEQGIEVHWKNLFRGTLPNGRAADRRYQENIVNCCAKAANYTDFLDN